jgi:uncharacterized YigZ family protein
MQNCNFKTINSVSESVYKEKGSKFIAYAYPLLSEDAVKGYVENLRKQHHGARHFCWAYKIGHTNSVFRVNDDGEPSNTAGKPILGQIDAFSITNILIVVVRYFGGTLLGVGGLIQAYKESAKLVLQEATIIEKTIEVFYKILFTYEIQNIVLSIVKQCKGNVVNQSFELQCEIECAIPVAYEDLFLKLFTNQNNINISRIHE